VSQPSLPDDPALWPDDPYELLGVPRNTGPRELRKAYTGLIRIYKPEQFPEQFRRVRAAYEMAQRLAEFFSAHGGSIVFGNEDAARPKPHDADPPAKDLRAGSLEVLPPPRPLDPSDDPHALWELAVAGRTARAYTGLQDLFRKRLDQPDIPLRLYWLLNLEPELDRGRDPCTWLTEALRLGQFAGPAVELYHRELMDRPAAAIEASEIPNPVDAPTDRLAGFLTARIAAAAGLRRWETVRTDLQRGRDLVRPTDELSWLWLVLATVDHLAWAVDGSQGLIDPVNQMLADCRRELTALGHLAIKHGEAFDRYEALSRLAAGWGWMRQNRNLPQSMLDLLPMAWTRSFPEVRPLMETIFVDMAAAPQKWLKSLDLLAHRSPSALAYFGNLLTQYQDRLMAPPAVPHTPADLARMVAEFIESDGRKDYRVLRPRLLAFCLREAIEAECVAALAPIMPVGGKRLAQAIVTDAPLQYVTLACRLAWA
jgi:hypothetical protein